ncbi:hypothetical protein HNQ91_004899 [Filimonas zeae]|uniref:hypothetical protein n=1 Tax=Filimonas zeae TaxID=1737353 RepID=UPI00166B3C0C|nr:hypothetical protein [Filimonas zeae]MDR6341822.1 hypothetical protein [Filimonas zeae]
MSANTLFFFPLDKVLLIFFVFALVIARGEKMIVPINNWIIYILVLISCVVSSAINLTASVITLFPIPALAFVYFAVHYKDFFRLLYGGMTLHVVLGFLILIVSYIIPDIGWYGSLWTKGMPFIHTPMGFVSTVQVYGTLCIIWLILYYCKRRMNDVTRVDKLLYFIVTVAIIATCNRSTYLFYFLLLIFNDRRILLLYFIVVSIAIILLFNEGLGNVLFNIDTLESRSELLEGFNLSFWKTGNIYTYLFGRGTNILGEEVLNKVKWDYRSDIENGYAMLLHTYGFWGLGVFVFSALAFVVKLFLQRHWQLGIIVFYYFFISSYFTQEFVSTSFYLLIIAVCLVSNMNKKATYEFTGN